MPDQAIVFPLVSLLVLVAACAPQMEPVQPPSGGCVVDADCVPAQCCHATSCVPRSEAPGCEGIFCTMECRPGSIDCGGGCFCENEKCVAKTAEQV